MSYPEEKFEFSWGKIAPSELACGPGIITLHREGGKGTAFRRVREKEEDLKSSYINNG